MSCPTCVASSRLKYRLTLCLVVGIQVVGLCFMFYGVVGGVDNLSPSSLEPSSENKRQNEGGEGPGKVVLMVIDALRFDMMTPERFPFLLGTLRRNRGVDVLLYNVTVDCPTVTLPRIKTLITGRSPTYLDIVKNLQVSDTAYSSNQLKQENIIGLLKDNNPDFNICIFGDETWLRLFPIQTDGTSKYLFKWEGVNSFFVNDFVEVDKNVTKNLKHIQDCHFVILHYLGLDHIGHVHGPTSRPELITKKLQEMDKVIQKIQTMLHNRGEGTKGSPSLLLVTGDHGMANVGGHGGSTFEEVTTPLVAIMSHSSPTKPRKQQTRTVIQQTDIAPTLAAIWGLKIPAESRGRLILDILEPFQTVSQLAETYRSNCEQLLTMLSDPRETSVYQLWLTEMSKMPTALAITKYIELENELSDRLKASQNSNNSIVTTPSFILGTLLVLIGFSSSLLLFIYRSQELLTGAVYPAVLLATFPPLLCYFSSSFVEEEHYIRYFLFSSLILYIHILKSPSDFTYCWSLVKVLCFHRVLTSFNQTGDKWSHLRDVNDILMDENLIWLSTLIGFLLVWRFVAVRNGNPKVFTTSLLLLYVIKVGVEYDLLLFMGMDDPLLGKMGYFLILVNSAWMLLKETLPNNVFLSALLLSLHLQRCSNVIVVGLLLNLLLEMSAMFSELCSRRRGDSIRYPIDGLILTYGACVWLSCASFFYQGNSNGLATIDVGAGYIGLSSSSSNILIGALLFFNTYGNPILVQLYFISNRVKTDTTKHSKDMKNETCTSCTVSNTHASSWFLNSCESIPFFSIACNGAEGAVYFITIIIFQRHLFIWSVFVPKLLYLISQSVMFLILSFVNLVM